MMSLLFRDSSRKASADPLSGFWYSSVSAPTASREPVTEATALTYSAVWAATRLLSGTGGWLPLDLYRRLTGGGREVALDDPRETMVHDRPNGDMSSMMFRCQGIAQQVNAGNCYAEIEREETRKKRPVKLWPIHHSRVKVHRDESGLWYEVKNNDGTSIAIDAADMLHVPSMMSDDGISGKGVIQHARESIGFGLATEKYGAAWFGKGSVPRLALSHPGKLTPEARANMRSEWKEAYGGPDGSRVAVLQEGVKLESISVNNEDSQFLETRGYNVKEIARWYGVPPHMIGDLEHATFSNIEHQGIEFVVYSLIPWLKLWEQELWAKLLSPEEQVTHYFEFNVTALMRGDAAARASFYTALSNIGAINRNEIRETENLNPVPGGDVFLVQGAMFAIGDEGIPVNTTAAVAGEPVPGPAGRDGADGADGKDGEPGARGEKGDRGDAGPAGERGLDGTNHDPRQLEAVGTRVSELEGSFSTLRQNIRKDATLREVSRLAYKEMQAASRAANHPNTFLAWIDEFYEKHQSQLAGEVGEAASSEWCAVSREKLLEASEATPQMFPLVVAKCVSQWNTTRVAEFVTHLTEQKA